MITLTRHCFPWVTERRRHRNHHGIEKQILVMTMAAMRPFTRKTMMVLLMCFVSWELFIVVKISPELTRQRQSEPTTIGTKTRSNEPSKSRTKIITKTKSYPNSRGDIFPRRNIYQKSNEDSDKRTTIFFNVCYITKERTKARLYTTCTSTNRLGAQCACRPKNNSYK